MPAKKSAAKEVPAKKAPATSPPAGRTVSRKTPAPALAGADDAIRPSKREAPPPLVPPAQTVGTKSFAVKDLQVFLADQGHYRGRIDGHYGNLTRNAVAAWQAHMIRAKAFNGRPDGNFNPQTRTATVAYLNL